MPGLVPGIHVFLSVGTKTWMAGTSPAMTLDRPEATRIRNGRRALPLLGLTLFVLAACDLGGGFGYVEIKSTPAAPPVALYLDSVKLEPIRNGNAVLRQKVGTVKLQADGDGGQLAVLCNIEVRKNRITTVTVSLVTRQPRCQCGRTSGTDAAANRTCIG
jgi:hypothetical protein